MIPLRKHPIHAGHILGSAACLFLPLAIVAPLGIAPLTAVAAVAVLALAVHRRQRPRLFSPAIAAVLGAMLVWSAISLGWTTSTAAPGNWIQLALALIAGGVLTDAAARLEDQERPAVEAGLLGGFALGLAMLAIEAVSNGVLMGALFERATGETYLITLLNRAATVAALLAWPAGMVLLVRGRRLWAAALGLMTLVILSRFESGAAVAGLAVGFLAFALTRLAPRLAPMAVAAALVVTILAMPLVSATLLEPARFEHLGGPVEGSSIHRLYIWRFAAERIAEKPVLGWGFDSSRHMPGGKQAPTGFSPGIIGADGEMLPLHPHNAALQWWLELGVAGALLAVALIVFLFRAILRLPAGDGRAAATGLVSSAMTIALLSYGIWQGWWAASLWLAAALAVAVQSRSRTPLS